MVIGNFDPDYRPFVFAEMDVYAIKAKVLFLIDTGALDIIFCDTDAKRLGIDYWKLPNPIQVTGFGGSLTARQISAEISFVGAGIVYSYGPVVLLVGEPSHTASGFPSVLGQEILHRFGMTLCHLRSQLVIEPISYDFRVP